MHILILDDNEMNRRVLDGFLKKDAHETTLCKSAEDALQCCKENIFDAVIADINLQGMDGMEFTRRLRRSADARTARTPVIALSGDVSAEDRKSYERANMNGFLAKPLDPDALAQMLLKIESSTLDTPVIIPEVKDRPPEKQPVPEDPEDDEIPDVVKMAMKAESEEKEAREEAEEEEDTFDSFAPDIEPPVEQNKSGDTDLFNPHLLVSLSDALPKDQFDDLLKSFLDKADEIIETLEQAAEQNMGAEILIASAHDLKGMCANFGLTGVSAPAAAIESAAQKGDLESAFASIKKLSEINQRAQSELQRWLDSL